MSQCPEALSRRTVLLAAGATFTTLPGIAVGASGDESSAGYLATMAAAAQSNPYVSAGMAAFKLYGAIADHNWQGQVNDQLRDIRKQLSEINAKLDILLAEVRRLPEIIERKLKENEKNSLISDIKAKILLIDSIVANYPAGARPTFNAYDLTRVKDKTTEILEASFKLQDWGIDAFVTLGVAYAEFLFVTKLTGVSVASPEYIRNNFLTSIKKSHDIFDRYAKKLLEESWTLKRQLDPVPGWTYLGWSPASSGAQTFSYYVQVGGSLETGFTLLRDDRQLNGINTRTLRSVQSLGPLWAQKYDPRTWRSSEAGRGFVTAANQLASRQRTLEAELKEALALVASSQAVMDGMVANALE